VDEDDRLPIGRPTLTLAIDVYSRMPFGIRVGFEPPSYFAVMGCLFHGILPKADVREMYGTRNCWPVYGLPEKLVCDNGREFVGRDLEDACAQLGIILEPNPPRSPWYKGAIERFIRTHNTGLVHTLPGSTYSNLAARGDYDPAHHACVTLSAFNRLLHVWLLDVYAQDWHEGARGIPAKLWEESLASGWEPTLHHSAEEVRILLRRTAERTLGRTGIDLESLRYQSPDLARLRSLLPVGARVRVKYDPGDLGGVHVYDSTDGGGWLHVPALDQEYASGLSLWKHRALRRLVLAEKGEVDIHALAEAKDRVRDTAREEMKNTRRARGRKRAARLLGAGDGRAPTAPSSAREHDPRTLPQPAPTAGRAEAAASGEGWGGDYELPTRGEQPW
jgi:putative transposase